MDTTTNIRRLAPFAAAAAVIALCSAMALPHGTPPSAPHTGPNARVAEYLLAQPHATVFHTGPSNATIADGVST
jgi:hypothetical protein